MALHDVFKFEVEDWIEKLEQIKDDKVLDSIGNGKDEINEHLIILNGIIDEINNKKNNNMQQQDEPVSVSKKDLETTFYIEQRKIDRFLGAIKSWPYDGKKEIKKEDLDEKFKEISRIIASAEEDKKKPGNIAKLNYNELIKFFSRIHKIRENLVKEIYAIGVYENEVAVNFKKSKKQKNKDNSPLDFSPNRLIGYMKYVLYITNKQIEECKKIDYFKKIEDKESIENRGEPQKSEERQSNRIMSEETNLEEDSKKEMTPLEVYIFMKWYVNQCINVVEDTFDEKKGAVLPEDDNILKDILANLKELADEINKCSDNSAKESFAIDNMKNNILSKLYDWTDKIYECKDKYYEKLIPEEFHYGRLGNELVGLIDKYNDAKIELENITFDIGLNKYLSSLLKKLEKESDLVNAKYSEIVKDKFGQIDKNKQSDNLTIKATNESISEMIDVYDKKESGKIEKLLDKSYDMLTVFKYFNAFIKKSTSEIPAAEKDTYENNLKKLKSLNWNKSRHREIIKNLIGYKPEKPVKTKKSDKLDNVKTKESVLIPKDKIAKKVYEKNKVNPQIQSPHRWRNPFKACFGFCRT